jgi:23S rRNA (pseudouridine1915-N3)-methyltransferase
MRLRLLTICHKAPAWIQQGYEEYAKRLPPSCALELIEIPAEKRTPHADAARLKEREGEKMLSLIKPNHYVIALDINGQSWSTEQLAKHLDRWQHEGHSVDLLIGGADGLAAACLKAANTTWSLSPLTFPHMLVRIMIAEQIYRAWSILQQHPYHK